MIYRSAFLLPVAIRNPANTLAAQIGIDPEELHNTLSVPLVPANGPADGEPTHYACCGILTEAQREALEQASEQFPSALWWRWEELTGKLAACYSGEVENTTWSWEQSLEASALKVFSRPTI